MSVAIKVENISKKYIIKHKEASYETLSEKIPGTIKKVLKGDLKRPSKEEFWALQNINFDIQQGDRVGIIGRNGAGKSTLLKILSRIVSPTTGRIEINGRLASLLEVGTGFHGDLTGRENIFLNGAILGMSKTEIASKFDEIVDFSEVEKFIDTPVKRYSSGMYVRLAFAVAAHLEPEILIVDEVLAVGDAAFQKKCIGKMEESSQKDGKTILFVSHNMGQISALCNKGILLNKGKIESQGDILPIVNQYFNSGKTDETDFTYEDNAEKEFVIKHISVLNAKKEHSKNFAHNESICLGIEIHKNKFLNDVILGVYFSDIYDKKIFTTQIPISDMFVSEKDRKLYVIIPHSVLLPNTYAFTVAIHIPNIQVIDEKQNVSAVHIYDNGSEFYKYAGTDMGTVFLNCDWQVS